MKEEIGLIYFRVYECLKVKSNLDGVVSRRDFHTILGRNFHIPKPHHDLILKELEGLNFLDDLQKNGVRINSITTFDKKKKQRIQQLKKFL